MLLVCIYSVSSHELIANIYNKNKPKTKTKFN